MIRRLLVLIGLSMAAGGFHAFAGEDSTSAPIASGSAQAVNGGTFYSPLPEKVQEDIGDIRPVSNAPFSSYFHGQATVNAQYTSNAPLYHSHDRADLLIAPVIQGGFAAPLSKYFRVDVEARVEDFTYASDQKLGFYGFSGNGDIEYRYKPSWPRFYVGVEPYYYWSYATGDRLTAAVGPVAGVDQTVSLDRGKTLLLAGYHFGNYFGSPSADTYQAHTVTVALTQQLKRDLYAQFYYQFQYSRYYVYGRDELRDVIGVSLIHQFTPQTFASVFFNFVDNASNNAFAKYTTTNTGVSLVWQY